MISPIPESSSSFQIQPEIKLVKPSELDAKTAMEAIGKLNKSVGWTKYTSSITHKYFNDDHMRLALKDGNVVGYVTFRDYTEGKKHEIPHCYVPYIAVDPDHQGSAKGNIGVKMMEEVILLAKVAGASKLVLEYRGNKEKTKGFYEKIGRVAEAQIKDKNKGTYSDGSGDLKNKFTFYLKTS